MDDLGPPNPHPSPRRKHPQVGARVPARLQRAARARAEILGITYGDYLTQLIERDTANNVGALMDEASPENTPENAA